jgi:hypothetical protein
MARLERYWINAPSTLQPVHHWNGRNVFVDKSDRDGVCVTVYFTEGPTISAMIPKMYLSAGWQVDEQI